MGCRSASAFASASFVSKVSAYIAAAEALYPILFEPFDANDENAAFPIVAPLRAPFIMALRNTKKVAGRSSKRGKKMPALDELHDIGLPVCLLAAMFGEFHEQLFAFTVAQPLDISPRKQRKPVKFGSDEAKANKARLHYFNEASDPCSCPDLAVCRLLMVAETTGDRGGPLKKRPPIRVARCITAYLCDMTVFWPIGFEVTIPFAATWSPDASATFRWGKHLVRARGALGQEHKGSASLD